MKKIVITVAVTLAVLISGFYLYIFSGAYDISQLTPHNKLTKSIINITTHKSINSRLKDIVVPKNFADSTMIIEGFKHYNEMCVMCHAAPGMHADEMAEGLYPQPPELFKHSSEEDAQEFFWIIKNGIKMTSMPAYKPTHNDEKIWAITAFVTHKLGKMSPEEYINWVLKDAEIDNSAEIDDEK